MLCFKHQYNRFGEICTNRCPDRQKCNIQKTSILIEALDNLSSEIESGEVNGFHVSFLIPYCTSPEAYLNGAIYENGATAKNESKLFKS